MANSNRVFVSPGVYTSEKDLTFVAQSVGVTTLGLVGETQKGPAFEPILISNFDEFKTYFGGTSPEKYGNNNPKYELPYVAKSYLQESNQLFVTRVLGLTGYKPEITLGITTLGGLEPVGASWDLSLSGSTTGITMDPTPRATFTGSTIYAELNSKKSVDGDSITDFIYKNYSGTTGNNGIWFAIGQIPDSDIPNGAEQVSPMTGKLYANSIYNNNWYNVYNNGSSRVYSYLFVWNGSTNLFQVKKYTYNSMLNADYDGIVVAALRSRGSYDVHQQLNLEITNPGDFNTASADGFDVTTNPLGEFMITVSGATSGLKEYTCSLNTSSSKYIKKVLGGKPFDKSATDFPIYVHEVYPKLLKTAFEKGYVRGLRISSPTYTMEGSNFAQPWDTTISPMVVSEVRGGKVADLFQVQTISDGEDANFQLKVSVININLDNGEFDLLIRDYGDTDENMVVLEKYSRCSMNPEATGYVGRKIGTSDGEYQLRSKYVTLIMADNHPTDAIPAGFKGFVAGKDADNDIIGSVLYKTKYYDAGNVIGYNTDGSEIITSGDKVKKVMLGISSQVGFDSDLLKYKGYNANHVTYGFHLSVNAATITGSTPSGYEFQTTQYNLEGQIGTDNKLTNINYRKFTFAVYGGHDGWDIYRDSRTNTDSFILGKQTYASGSTDNGGVFRVAQDGSPNSDYYAYLQGINTFSNPEAVDINLFATPGIDWSNHGSLVSNAIDMIENDRADSLYVINAPGPEYITTANDIANELDNMSIDSNYSATYWPWIQVKDTDNSTQLFIPPTGEVLKNIALTDNVSYPWFAPAGYSRGLVNAIKATKKLTLDERDELYKYRINPIATFADTGTIVWGNKTLQVKESALDRINVRRLLLRARKLISAVAVRLLFEQNDEQVRNEFLRLVNPILDSIKKERGLNEFKVTVSNDPEDIDANTLRGKIYIKPTRALEFIDLEFIITPTGASFENI
jgi:Phage tail sheath protein subtilisin-like domain